MENKSEEVVAVFSRAFVMPEERFKKIVLECSENEKCDIHKVAERFGVDYSDAYIRGRELGLWDIF